MPSSDYQRVREIGSGSFGRALLVQSRSRGLCVMKEIDLSGKDPQQRRLAEQEVKVLSNLKHPYIVRYWESFSQGDCLCIIMDYCEGGDLLQYIQTCRRRSQPIPEPQVLRWFTQMTLALKYMHEMKVLHRDLKSQNMFLANREGGGGPIGCVKIADFGIAKVLGEGHQAFARTLVGTPYYLSPEMCMKEPYATPSDIWAFGCVIYELCALHVPFEAHDLQELVQKIVKGGTPRIPTSYSRDLSDICAEMLQRNAHRRPPAAAILQKPMVQIEMKRMLAENKREHGDRRDHGGEERSSRTPSSHRERGACTPSSRSSAPPSSTPAAAAAAVAAAHGAMTPHTPSRRSESARHGRHHNREDRDRERRHEHQHRDGSRAPSSGSHSRDRNGSAEPTPVHGRRPLSEYNGHGREPSKTPRAHKQHACPLPSPPVNAAMEVLRSRGPSPSHGHRHR